MTSPVHPRPGAQTLALKVEAHQEVEPTSGAFVNKHGGGLRGGRMSTWKPSRTPEKIRRLCVSAPRHGVVPGVEINSSHEYLATFAEPTINYEQPQQQEQQHRDLVEELKRLDDMINEQQGTSERDPVDDETDRLDAELIDLQKIKDALVQRDIFTHMINRLSEEALDIQVEGTQIEAELQKDSNELQQCNVALQQAKQELKHEERKFHALQAKVNERRETQKARISDIEKIIAEREQLVQRQQERTKQRDKLLSQGQLDAGKPEDTKVKKMQVVRKVYNSMLEKKISNEEDDLAQLEATFQHIKIVTGLASTTSFKNSSSKGKAEQLERDADDIRQRIETLKVENEKQRQILEAMRARAITRLGIERQFSDGEEQPTPAGLETSMRRSEEARVSFGVVGGA